MFKKTVTFEDFNGNKQTKDFYFHISKAEFLAMAANGEAMQERLKRITSAVDGVAILKEFRDLIKLGVGIRSEDGQRFIKDAEAQSILLDSPAFDELLMELATDASAATEFVQQLLPEKLQKEMVEQLKNAKTAGPFAEPEDNRPAYQKEHRLPTDAEVRSMTATEIQEAWQWREKNNR